ncbi:MAG: DnaJ-class molecular chaperone CbpA [Myxococcaceae bacterium]|nr:DnaJ-class molecular chaperone CbpA [Myxococcaceae bacterium]
MPEASDERAAPSATGTLASRPLVHLLVYARNRRLTGSLELRAEDGRSGTITLWRGRIHDARTQPPVAYFGAVAYELGHIDTPTLDATLLEISKSKRLHGEVLVDRGAITRTVRDQILSEQMCRKIHHMFSLPPEATFAFYEAKPSTQEPAFTLDPIKPTWLGLRAHPPLESVREVIARFEKTTLRMSNEGPAGRAGLDADELALCDALTWKPMTLAQLRAAAAIPQACVDLLVYLLVITKCAEPAPAPASSPAMPAVTASRASMPAIRKSQPSMPAVRESQSSMPAVRTSQPAINAAKPTPESGEVRVSMSFRVPSAPAIRTSGGSSPRIAAQVAPVFSPADLGAVGIAHRAATIENEDPFTALGIPDGSSVEAARAAYFRLSKLWHPDRLPADLAPFRMEVEKVYEHMTRAHRTLTDPDARRDYLATGAASGPRGSAPAAARPRAEMLREIDHALTKREFHAAEAASRQLASADPDDSEAQALVAWASTLAGEASEDTLRAALPMLDRAVNRDRQCERAHYYRGMVHKRLGGNAAAFRDFTRVVNLNPKHVDAQREIRIFEMRARKGSGEHALDALISKAKKK